MQVLGQIVTSQQHTMVEDTVQRTEQEIKCSWMTNQSITALTLVKNPYSYFNTAKHCLHLPLHEHRCDHWLDVRGYRVWTCIYHGTHAVLGFIFAELLFRGVYVSAAYRIHERQKRWTAQKRKGGQDEWSPILIKSAPSSSINRGKRQKKKKKKQSAKELEHLYTVNK